MSEEPDAEIVVEEGPEKGRVLPLRPSKVIEIGREGNFRLDDPALSRHHCSIRFEGGRYRVRDEGSSWGTFHNGEKIREAVLADGDRVRVGNHTLRFSTAKDAQPGDATRPVSPEWIPTPRAPLAASAVEAADDDEEDIPSASPSVRITAFDPEEDIPAAAPTRTPEVVRLDEGEEEPEEAVPEGACANCAKPLPDPAAREDGAEGETAAYCPNCLEQYPLLGRVIANHRCERVLGAGGMGIVYRATHVVLGRRAAVKTLKVLAAADPVLVQRLLREATAGGRISHPNIVSVQDTGEQDKVAYVVMEYVRGENLAEALKREKKFPVDRALRFVTQVAEALAAGYRLGFIHRDIKPENILLRRDDTVKVTDFGLAKNIKDGELGGLTRTGQVLGTMVYIAPEQIVSSKGSDQRADIYSLGATFFHLVAGRPPFDSKSAITLLMQIRKEQAPVLRSVVPEAPEAIERIIDRCLRKDPAERYQTPDELVADLKAVG